MSDITKIITISCTDTLVTITESDTSGNELKVVELVRQSLYLHSDDEFGTILLRDIKRKEYVFHSEVADQIIHTPRNCDPFVYTPSNAFEALFNRISYCVNNCQGGIPTCPDSNIEQPDTPYQTSINGTLDGLGASCPNGGTLTYSIEAGSAEHISVTSFDVNTGAYALLVDADEENVGDTFSISFHTACDGTLVCVSKLSGTISSFPSTVIWNNEVLTPSTDGVSPANWAADVSTDCPSGFSVDPLLTIVEQSSGESFGPFTTLPQTITPTGGDYAGVPIQITGTLDNTGWNINAFPAIFDEDSLNLEMSIVFDDDCTAERTATATLNVTPPVTNVSFQNVVQVNTSNCTAATITGEAVTDCPTGFDTNPLSIEIVDNSSGERFGPFTTLPQTITPAGGAYAGVDITVSGALNPVAFNVAFLPASFLATPLSLNATFQTQDDCGDIGVQVQNNITAAQSILTFSALTQVDTTTGIAASVSGSVSTTGAGFDGTNPLTATIEENSSGEVFGPFNSLPQTITPTSGDYAGVPIQVNGSLNPAAFNLTVQPDSYTANPLDVNINFTALDDCGATSSATANNLTNTPPVLECVNVVATDSTGGVPSVITGTVQTNCAAGLALPIEATIIELSSGETFGPFNSLPQTIVTLTGDYAGIPIVINGDLNNANFSLNFQPNSYAANPLVVQAVISAEDNCGTSKSEPTPTVSNSPTVVVLNSFAHTDTTDCSPAIVTGNFTTDCGTGFSSDAEFTLVENSSGQSFGPFNTLPQVLTPASGDYAGENIIVTGTLAVGGFQIEIAPNAYVPNTPLDVNVTVSATDNCGQSANGTQTNVTTTPSVVALTSANHTDTVDGSPATVNAAFSTNAGGGFGGNLAQFTVNYLAEAFGPFNTLPQTVQPTTGDWSGIDLVITGSLDPAAVALNITPQSFANTPLSLDVEIIATDDCGLQGSTTQTDVNITPPIIAFANVTHTDGENGTAAVMTGQVTTNCATGFSTPPLAVLVEDNSGGEVFGPFTTLPASFTPTTGDYAGTQVDISGTLAVGGFTLNIQPQAFAANPLSLNVSVTATNNCGQSNTAVEAGVTNSDPCAATVITPGTVSLDRVFHTGTISVSGSTVSAGDSIASETFTIVGNRTGNTIATAVNAGDTFNLRDEWGQSVTITHSITTANGCSLDTLVTALVPAYIAGQRNSGGGFADRLIYSDDFRNPAFNAQNVGFAERRGAGGLFLTGGAGNPTEIGSWIIDGQDAITDAAYRAQLDATAAEPDGWPLNAANTLNHFWNAGANLGALVDYGFQGTSMPQVGYWWYRGPVDYGNHDNVVRNGGEAFTVNEPWYDFIAQHTGETPAAYDSNDIRIRTWGGNIRGLNQAGGTAGGTTTIGLEEWASTAGSGQYEIIFALFPFIDDPAGIGGVPLTWQFDIARDGTVFDSWTNEPNGRQSNNTNGFTPGTYEVILRSATFSNGQTYDYDTDLVKIQDTFVIP